MVQLTNEEWNDLTKKGDDKWAYHAREYMPAFFRLDLCAADTIALREDCMVAAGALQRVLAQLQGPCVDQSRVMLECQWILRIARQNIQENRGGKKRRFRRANRLDQPNGVHGNAE